MAHELSLRALYSNSCIRKLVEMDRNLKYSKGYGYRINLFPLSLAPLPREMEDRVKRDTVALKLCNQVIRWLPSAGYAPPELRERAIFRMRMRGGHLAGAAYLLRLSLSPTEEDWIEGEDENRSWLLGAIQRPLRLLKKNRSNDDRICTRLK